MVTPNCLWNVDCQIVSVLTFLAGAFAKLKRGHVKRYAVALKRLGGLALMTLPEASRLINPALSLCESMENEEFSRSLRQVHEKPCVTSIPRITTLFRQLFNSVWYNKFWNSAESETYTHFLQRISFRKKTKF